MRQIHRLARAVATLAAAGAAGCASYEPKPILTDEVLRELRAVRLEAVRPADVPATATQGAVPARFDPAAGLGPDEAVAVALALNPDLRAFRKERGVAEGELVAAGLLPNPELGVTWLYLENFTKGLASGSLDASLSWAPPRPGELDALRARARARIEEVRAELASEEWRLAAEARNAYAAVWAAEERLRLVEASLALRERIRQLFRNKRDAGDASRIDLNLVEVDFADVLRERAVAAGAVENARFELNRLLGLPPRYELKLRAAGDPLAFKPFAVDARALESLMVARRPDLEAARREYEQAEQALRLAYIQRWPWFRFGPAFMRDELEGKVQNRLGLGLGIDLPIVNLNQGEIAILEARRERLREAFIARVHRARAEVNEALGRMIVAERLIRTFEESVRPALDENAALTEAGFRTGDLELTRLISAQDKVLRARGDFIEAVLDYWRAVHDLERAIGARLFEAERSKE